MIPSAPIQRVPDDVLLELLSTVYQFSEFDWVNTVDDRTLLCLVCREWQNTILSNARFWSSVPITGMTSAAFIERQLVHSGKRDLNVFINLDVFTLSRKLNLPIDCSLKGPVHTIYALLPLVLPQFHRVATLTAKCLNEAEWFSIVGVIREDHAPRLRSLAVSIDSNPNLNVVLPAFEHTPALTSLAITTKGMWTDPAIYQHVETLRLTGEALSPAWSSFAGALNAAPSLRCLQLIKTEWPEWDEFTHEKTTSVTDLHVSFVNWWYARPLYHIHLPRLHTLRISTADSATFNATSLVDVLFIFAESLPRITTLELSLCASTASSPVDLIVAAAHISHLNILPPYRSTWTCLVKCARIGTLRIPKIRSINVAGALSEDDVHVVLKCTATGCVIEATEEELGIRGTRWVLEGESLCAETVSMVNKNPVSDGMWKTEMYGRRKLLKLSTEYAPIV